MLSSLMTVGFSQNAHQAETFTLSQTLPSSQSHEFTASSHIELLPGFSTEPSRNDSTVLRIDPYGVFPPEEGFTGGPHAADSGVVGIIGGSFGVGAMGAAVYTIPLQLPQGINGMQPSLSVTYNSQGGNGLMGWGWDLSGISSVTRTGRTLYHDGEMTAADLSSEDCFLLDGRRLIQVDSTSSSVEYRTEQDEMSKIVSYISYVPTGSGTARVISHFTVWRADGLIMEYGATESAWIDPQDTCRQALCWMLDKVSDRDGNAILYHYNESEDTGEFFVDSILYTSNQAQGVPAQFAVTFQYQNYRWDEERCFIGGNQILMRHLLKGVTVTSLAEGRPLLHYAFDYEWSAALRYNVLTAVSMEAFDEEGGVERFNATRIERDASTQDQLLHYAITTPDVLDGFPFTGDFDGDGYTDVAMVPYKDGYDYDAPVDIRVYLNDRDRGFVHAPTLDIENVPVSLDWVHVADLNGDGLDDMLLYLCDTLDYHVLPSIFMEYTLVKVLLRQTGSQAFSQIDSVLLFTRCDLITGDFDGNGTCDAVLLQKKDKSVTYDNANVTMPHLENAVFLGFQGGQFQKRLLNQTSLEGLGPVYNTVAADYDGDGITDILLLGVLDYTSGLQGSAMAKFDFDNPQHCIKVWQRLSTGSYPHQLPNGEWCHVFPGDFNGDGKADVLFQDYNKWKICLSMGHRLREARIVDNGSIPYTNSYRNLYQPSLSLLGQSAYNQYTFAVAVADFDGDGCSDFAHTYSDSSMVRILTKLVVEQPNHVRFIGSVSSNPMSFSSRYIHTGNFLGRENASFLGWESDVPGGGAEAIGIHSPRSVGRYASVTAVTDGLGNRVSFTYDWLSAKTEGTEAPFYTHTYSPPDSHGVRPVPPGVRALSSVEVEGVNGSSTITRYRYRNAMHHRYGHGFLGFQMSVAETFRNGTDNPWKTRTVKFNETGTMGRYAMMLPDWEASYVNSEREPRAVSRTQYTFSNAVFSSPATDLVVCPAMTAKTEDLYSMDDEDELEGTVTTTYQYDYGTDHTYGNAYGCTASTQTVTGYEHRTARCELVTSKQTVLQNVPSSWIVNRPLNETVTRTRNNGSVSSKTVYTYNSNNRYRPDAVTVIPNDGSQPNDPLTLFTSYAYDGFGNVTEVSVSAPYGIHGETARATRYEYGPEYRHRLLTRETVGPPDVGYATTYSYGLHDRPDTVTDCNGMRTLHSYSVLGTDRNVFSPDGTEQRERILWAKHSPYKPSDASYYTWSKSTGGGATMTFYHKSGAELRRVCFDFHGNPVFTDRRYDTVGLLEKESLPYRMGTAEEDIRWTVYVYDGHDRVDSVVYPDGSSERFAYNGLETACTATPPQGSSNATPRRTKKRLNVLGWPVENEDAEGTTVSYEYFADGSPKWARAGSDETTKVSMEYDNAGNRTRLHDPDYCTAQSDLVSEYDAFGQEVRRTTPRQFTYTFSYDRYGRMTGRVEDDVAADGSPVSRTTTWQYGETAPRKGLLLSVTHPEQAVSYAYDTCQRRICDTVRIAGAAYVTRYDYDRASRVASVTHPSGFTVMQRYNASGYPCVQTDADGKELYRTRETSPSGQTERFSLGGILDNTLEYDPERNLVTAMKTKKGTATLQDLLCGYDGFRNLASRKDNRIDMEETFTYDDMDRLTGVRLGTTPTGAMAYDTYGRMTSKSAGGSPVFSGAVFGAASKPHALDRAFTPSGTFPSTPQTVSYTGFDKVLKVKQGNDSVVFAYGHDRQRISMEEHVGNTVRTKRYVGACEYVTESSGLLSTERWLTYLTGPTGVYAVVETSGSTNTLHYVLKDNLGSWTTITDSDGNMEQRLSYDAWGNLRDPATWSGSFTGTPMFDRGFTGHEHLYNFGLINMNGRMYDPVMSSFLSVDQYVQDPSSAQGFNRYAYCGHNPLRYVDPSGWQMKPNPGSSPSSNDYYQDIYSYVERAYEPRDLGILQLSTDDPIVIWMEENELHGGGGVGDEGKGGFYDTNGKKLGSMPNINGKVYIIRSETIDNKTRREIRKFFKGKKTSITEETILQFFIEIESSQANRQKMLEIVSQDDGTGGTSPSNNREYGGYIDNGRVIEMPPGPIGDPKDDASLSIILPKGYSTFHSHASGYRTEKDRTNIGHSWWEQYPTDIDILNAENETHYVFGRWTNYVYIYTCFGVQTIVTTNTFIYIKP